MMDRLTAAQVFVEVVERGSQTAAAEALNMSRAMVSRYLAELESWAAVRLLHRSTRRLSLTAAGEQMLPQCREMLALAESMQALGQRPGRPHGVLRVACSQSLAQAWLVHEISAFTAQYPQVSVDLTVGSEAVNLVQARIDLALRITNELDANLIARRIATCRSVLCASPAYLAVRGTPQRPHDLSQHDCLRYTRFSQDVWRFTRADEEVDVEVSGHLGVNESMVLLEATLAGGGISLQPLFAAQPWLESGHLLALLPEFEPVEFGIYALYGSRRQMLPAARLLLDRLAERMQADPMWHRVPH